jgi:hypothetical protein
MKQKNTLIIIFTIICFGLISYANAQNVRSAKDSRAFTIPALNTNAITELGETVLSKGLITYGKGAELRELASFKKNDGKIQIEPCNLTLISEKKKEMEYHVDSDYLSYSTVFVKNKNGSGIVYVDKASMTIKSAKVVNFNYGKMKIVNSLKQPIILKEIEIVSVSQNNFKQEFIYNGKAGNILKFSYREFTNDMARPAFNQDVQYDLSESNEIGFKGARFLVLNATNMKLEYKVLSAFN